MRTPAQFQPWGVPEICSARKIPRWPWAYRAANGDKAQWLSTVLPLFAAGAIASPGDPAKQVDRVRQLELALFSGLGSRSTFTKRLNKWSSAEKCPKCHGAKIEFLTVDQLRCASCGTVFEPLWNGAKRLHQSEQMKDIAAKHPHWSKTFTTEDTEVTEEEHEVEDAAVDGTVQRKDRQHRREFNRGSDDGQCRSPSESAPFNTSSVLQIPSSLTDPSAHGPGAVEIERQRLKFAAGGGQTGSSAGQQGTERPNITEVSTPVPCEPEEIGSSDHPRHAGTGRVIGSSETAGRSDGEHAATSHAEGFNSNRSPNPECLRDEGPESGSLAAQDKSALNGMENLSPGLSIEDTAEGGCATQATQRPCLLVRNKAYAAPNTYALCMPEGLRPGVKSREEVDTAKILASHFGSDIFDPEFQANGFKHDWGWVGDPHLPAAPDCVCKKQKSFKFQGITPEGEGAGPGMATGKDQALPAFSVCPKCQGKGYVIGGTMGDNGRTLLRWLNDRGIDEEIRNCAACERSYSQLQSKHWPKCDGCGVEGRITKARGILTGWTQKRIAEANGMHKTTVAREFRGFRRLAILRTINGTVWRKCCGTLFNQEDHDACPKCKRKAKTCPIGKREPWKILLLIGRTMDADLVKSERQRLEAVIRFHRRFLEARQQEALEAAVALALNVLGEWSGHEHTLKGFYGEMRRRLNTAAYARFLNAIFPDTS